MANSVLQLPFLLSLCACFQRRPGLFDTLANSLKTVLWPVANDFSAVSFNEFWVIFAMERRGGIGFGSRFGFMEGRHVNFCTILTRSLRSAKINSNVDMSPFVV